MFVTKFIKTLTILYPIKTTVLNLKALEQAFNTHIPFKAFFDLKNLVVYKYRNILKKTTSNLPHINLFDYIIGIKNTPTNFMYHTAKTNGEVIIANTQNKIITALQLSNISSNSLIGLNHLLLALINNTKDKIPMKSSIILHLQDFKESNVHIIIKTLSEFYEIKTVVLTNRNPHNGCRPSKIKINKSTTFQHLKPNLT